MCDNPVQSAFSPGWLGFAKNVPARFGNQVGMLAPVPVVGVGSGFAVGAPPDPPLTRPGGAVWSRSR